MINPISKHPMTIKKYSSGFIDPIRHMDEKYVPVLTEGCEGVFISNYGKVYNSNTGYMIPSSACGNGYLQTSFNRRNFSLHRLELIAFNPIENYQNLQVNHIDCNKHNPFLTNLEWTDRSENMRHAYDNNLEVQGEDHPWSRVTTEQVTSICEYLMKRFSYKDICIKIGIEPTKENMFIVGTIRNKRNWKSISKDFEFPEVKTNKQVFTNEEIHTICKALEQHIPTKDILQNVLGIKVVGKGTYGDNENFFENIGKIRRRTGFTEISKDYNF